MRRNFFCTLAALCICGFSGAVNCTDIMVDVDTTNSYQLDVDGDGTIDFLFFVKLNPYVNSYVIGLNGNQIESEFSVSTYANRLIVGFFLGNMAWNDTAYTIQNGQGDFDTGNDEFGYVGLKLFKGSNWYYAYVEVRAPYSQPLLSLYRMGFNPVAFGPLKVEDCATVAVVEKNPLPANVMAANGMLQIALGNHEATQESILQLVNLNGQIVMERKLYEASTSVPVNFLKSGIYFAIIRVNGYESYRRKVLIP